MLDNNLLKKSDFLQGIRDSGPICIAFLFMSMSVGALSKNTGLSLLQTLSMGGLIYAIPLQVILLELLTKQGVILTLVLVTIVVNFRFFLMSTSLLPYFKKIPLHKVLVSLPLLSASAFTVSYVKFKTVDQLNHFSYYLGVGGISYIVSLLATTIGFYISYINHSVFLNNLLAMVLPIHFTALTAMRWPKLRPIIATLLGFLIMPISHSLFPNTGLVIEPLVIGAFMIFIIKCGRLIRVQA